MGYRLGRLQVARGGVGRGKGRRGGRLRLGIHSISEGLIQSRFNMRITPRGPSAGGAFQRRFCSDFSDACGGPVSESERAQRVRWSSRGDAVLWNGVQGPDPEEIGLRCTATRQCGAADSGRPRQKATASGERTRGAITPFAKTG